MHERGDLLLGGRVREPHEHRDMHGERSVSYGGHLRLQYGSVFESEQDGRDRVQ